MKLNASQRQAFVLSVMADIPKVDFHQQFEKLIKEDMLAVAPPVVAALLKDKEYAYILFTGGSNIRLPEIAECNYVRSVSSVSIYRGYKISAEAAKKAKTLYLVANKQESLLSEMTEKIEAAILGCSTLKMALAVMPEFAKYLPTEADKTPGAMLPMVANLAADLCKMGWPKDKLTTAA